jgi:hypothetical protein
MTVPYPLEPNETESMTKPYQNLYNENRTHWTSPFLLLIHCFPTHDDLMNCARFDSFLAFDLTVSFSMQSEPRPQTPLFWPSTFSIVAKIALSMLISLNSLFCYDPTCSFLPTEDFNPWIPFQRKVHPDLSSQYASLWSVLVLFLFVPMIWLVIELSPPRSR